jgi:hypothetical protein
VETLGELLCYLRDGACCTLVLVRAPARQVAEVLGGAVPQGEARLGLVGDMGATGWARVELRPCAELGIEHGALRGYEAILMLREGLPATRGQIPQSPPCFETPVSTAAMLSARLGTAAVAVWASDQGDGIGGIALLANGSSSSVVSAAGPAELEVLLERHLNGDDDDFDEDDEIKDEERHYLWPEAEYADGGFDEAADARLEALGFDLDFLGEPLWALIEGSEPHGFLGECFGIA